MQKKKKAVPVEPADFDEDDVVRRAFAAWFRSCRKVGALEDQPSQDSGVAEYKNLHYVVLRNVRGVMAVYRIRNDGSLKGLRRWPKEVEDA